MVLAIILDGVPESIVIGLGILEHGTVSLAMLVAVFISNLPEAIAGARQELNEATKTSLGLYTSQFGYNISSGGDYDSETGAAPCAYCISSGRFC